MEVAENIVFKCSRTHYADEFTVCYGEAVFLRSAEFPNSAASINASLQLALSLCDKMLL